MPNKYTCPHCGSENTSSVPLVYKGGHTTGHATNRELVGYTDVKTEVTVHADGSTSTKTSGGDAVYGSVTRPTESYSDLARTMPPPTKPEFHEKKREAGEFLGCITFLFCAGVVVSIGIYVFDNFDFIRNVLINSETWLKAELGKTTTSVLGLAVVFISWFFATGCMTGLLAELHNKFFAMIYKAENQRRREEYEKNMEIYRQERWEWEHSYICLRCGHRFFVDE